MRLSPLQFDLLALAVLAAIGTHLTHLPGWLAVAMLVLLGTRWLLRRLRPGYGGFPLWLRLPLTLALPVAMVAEYGNLFGREPGSALAAGMLVLKLGESETPRDARSAVTFGSFLLMAALLFGQDLAQTALVGLALLPQLAALHALQPRQPASGGSGALRGLFAPAAASLLGAAPLALAAFLFLPRLGAPLWGAPDFEQGKTGIGDDMTPGGLAELLIDDHPAFRAVFDGPVPPPDRQYWRTKVLWHFDGVRWTDARTSLPQESADSLYALGERTAYEVTLEPTRQDKLPVLDMPLALPEDAQRVEGQAVASRRPVDEVRLYRVESALAYRLDGLDPARRRLALQLPAGYNPKSLALARTWRAQSADEREIMRRALDLIRADFTYTLHPPPLGRDSMDDFLFETRAGYCEHFSSAFTELMRAAGIPARIVVGYQGGYWNPLANYLVVRQSDAHAWSEVWLADRGWVRVDPTGAVSPQRVQLGARTANAADKPWYGSDLLLGLRNRWDLVNRLWTEAVVRFDALRQASLLTPFGIRRAEMRELAIALAATGGVLLLGLLAWALRRDPPRGDAVDRAYARLLRELARRGVTINPTRGPHDLARHAERHLPGSAPAVRRLFAVYVELRYASTQPEPASSAAFTLAVRDFVRTPRLRRGTAAT